MDYTGVEAGRGREDHRQVSHSLYKDPPTDSKRLDLHQIYRVEEINRVHAPYGGEEVVNRTGGCEPTDSWTRRGDRG